VAMYDVSAKIIDVDGGFRQWHYHMSMLNMTICRGGPRPSQGKKPSRKITMKKKAKQRERGANGRPFYVIAGEHALKSLVHCHMAHLFSYGSFLSRSSTSLAVKDSHDSQHDHVFSLSVFRTSLVARTRQRDIHHTMTEICVLQSAFQ
jgi:hypothetical protein